MNYEEIYLEMRERNKNVILEKGVKFDPAILDTQPDSRVGLGIFAFYNNFTDTNLTNITLEVEKLFPNQPRYKVNPVARLDALLHFTFFQLFGVSHDNHSLDNLDLEKYGEVISQCLIDLGPFEVEFKGVMAIPTGLLITGYPSKDLNSYRDKLRDMLSERGLAYKEPYYTNTVHSTFMRFGSEESPTKLLEFAEKYKDLSIGKLLVDKFELGYGTWKMLPNEAKMKYTCNL